MYRNFIVLLALAAVLVLPGVVTAGPLTVLSGQELTINDTQTYTTLDITGGTLIIDPGAVVIFEQRSIVNGVGSRLVMNGGTCHVLGDQNFERLTLGDGSDATFIQNGGYFRVGTETSPGDAGDTKLGDSSGGVHYMYLRGGIFRTHRMEVDGGGPENLGTRRSHIIVGGGTLIVEDLGEGNPEVWAVTQEEVTGLLILRPDEGYIGLNILDYNDGKIVTAILGPGPTNPSPEDTGENACPEAVLTWSAGPNTQPVNGHQVYFGTSFDDVNDATTSVGLGVYQGTQSGTSFDPSPDLTMNTIYYWRVDQVNSAEAWNPWRGKVWTFTTNDGSAFDPDPEDDEIKVALDKVIGWTAGCGASLHDVYFSTDFDAVDTMNVSARVEDNYAGTTYNPGGFDYLIDYYWRIVEDDTYVGPVWHFQARSSIVDPNMKLWYEFNETDGNTVADSSGYQNPGDIDGFYEGMWDQGDSADGSGSISMDGGQRVNIPTDFLLIMPEIQISVSLWVKDAVPSSGTNWLFSIGGSMDNFPVEWNLGAAMPSDNGGVLFVAGEVPDDMENPTENDSNDVLQWTTLEGASPSGWEDDWHHFVFMKNETEGTMSIYFDGLLAEQRSGVLTGTIGTLKAKVDDLQIGAFFDNDNDFIGKLDDFRIFSYALSDSDVESLFRRGDLAGAWGPKPINGAVDVPRDANLAWRPGDFATHHDVYFGTDFDDVNDAVTVSIAFKGRQVLGNESYNPTGNMTLNKTYYWRIDEVNDVNNPDYVWKGKVWKFTVANYIVIDDFESYTKIPDNIWWTWENPDETGSYIGLGVGPLQPFLRGSQSMEYAYYNTGVFWPYPYYSETERNYASAQDWEEGGVKILTLFFYGDPDNDASSSEQMYVGLSDGSVRTDVDYPTNSDIQKPEWQEWNVALSEFTDVTLSTVETIYLGFGDPLASSPGGDGVVYIDDVRLYPPKCVPEFGPLADISGNCIVDLPDVRILGEHWLRTDEYLAVSAPAATPIAHWDFDGPSGATALDSGPSSLHGTLEGNYLRVAGYIGSGAVDFSGGRVLVPDAAVLRSMSELSVMAFIYSERSQSSARIVVKGPDNREAYELEVDDETDITFVLREDGTEDSFVRYDVNTNVLVLNEWIHVAGTYDGTGMVLYVNGQIADSNASVGAFTISQDPNGLAIGNRSDAFDRAFHGRIDDVRVYDTALTEAEIAYIATKETGTGYLPIQSLANLYDTEAPGSKIVNFRDYAVIMSAWLDEQLWPLP